MASASDSPDTTLAPIGAVQRTQVGREATEPMREDIRESLVSQIPFPKRLGRGEDLAARGRTGGDAKCAACTFWRRQ